MSTLVRTTKKFRRAFVPSSALAVRLEFKAKMMNVFLKDGRILGVPLAWFPLLDEASQGDREIHEICGGGVSIHWPTIDEDISVANLLAGADLHST